MASTRKGIPFDQHRQLMSMYIERVEISNRRIVEQS